MDDVSFRAGEGQFLTLLGPSGCGKTTLLKLIGGFYSADGGRIHIGEKDVTGDPPENRDTTMCFQSYALFPHLTVKDNITFGLKQRKVPAAEQESRFSAAAGQVDLGAQTEKYPSMLSGGQQQRVALARSLVMRSGIILFDEPLSNLDAKLRERVRIEIRRLQKEYGFTAVYVTHDQSEALAMSDQIIVMNKGRIEQQGTPQQIYQHPVNSFIADFIGTANIVDCEVVSSKGLGWYRVTSDLGDFSVFSDTEPASGRCRVSWRPEDVQMLSASQTADNSFQFLVSATAYQGNLTDVFVQNPAEGKPDFRIQAPSDIRCAAGDTIRFGIAPEKFRFLEALT